MVTNTSVLERRKTELGCWEGWGANLGSAGEDNIKQGQTIPQRKAFFFKKIALPNLKNQSKENIQQGINNSKNLYNLQIKKTQVQAE